MYAFAIRCFSQLEKYAKDMPSKVPDFVDQSQPMKTLFTVHLEFFTATYYWYTDVTLKGFCSRAVELKYMVCNRINFIEIL